MKFTILGHACLFIETENVSLLIDPWLVGSCYWRSWWNYPEVDSEILKNINPTHIYLTHLHWDHYHGPSLRKFYKSNPTILLPKTATKRMDKDLKRDFKFSKIVELSHAKKYKIGDNFVLSSYQFNPFFVDSSLAITADGVNILNANDSKVFGLSLKKIISDFKKFDFVLRSHSSATPFPYCENGSKPLESSRSPDEYSKDFLAFAEKCNATYAIPFASSHVYLHEGSLKFNKFYNSPLKVFNDSKNYDLRTKCIVMPSGSSWSKDSGFSIVNHDYSNINNHIEEMKTKYREKLYKQEIKSNKTRLNKPIINKYFKGFFDSLPFFLPRIRFAFFSTGNLDNQDKGTLITLDSKNKSINYFEDYYLTDNSLIDFKLNFVLKTYPYILNDCCLKEMFNTFTPSKLLRIYKGIYLRNSFFKVDKYLALTLLDLYENDSLPILKIFSYRQVINRIKRWREWIDMIIYIYKVRIRKLPIYRIWSELKISK